MTALQRFRCVCVLWLGVAGWASAWAAASTPGEELTRLLPDDAVFFVATSGGDALKADFETTILGRIWNDPGTQHFCSAIETGLAAYLQQGLVEGEDAAQRVKMLLECARLVLSRPLLFGIRPAGPETGMPASLFAICDAGEHRAELAAAVSRLETMLAENEVRDIDLGSRSMHGLTTKDDVPVYWGWVGDYFVIAGNDSQAAVVKHLIEPRATSAACLRKVPANGDALVLHWDIEKTLGLACEFFGGEAGDAEFAGIKPFLSDLGLNVSGMTVRVGFAGPDVVSNVFLAAPQPRTGLLAALKPVDISLFGMGDAQTMRAGAFNCDFAQVYDTLISAIKKVSPETYRDWEQGLAEFESQTDCRIREGLLASLSGPVVYSMFPAGRMLEAPMGGFSVVVKLADPQSFERNLIALGKFAADKAEENFQIGSQTDEAGRTLHLWASPKIALMQWMPTWAIVDDHLVFASNTPLCKRGVELVASKDQGPASLLQTEAFKQVRTRLPGDVISVIYADSQVQFTQSMTAMQMLWPTLTMLTVGPGVNLPAMLPSLGHIAKDMRPSCQYSYFGPDGLYSCYRGTGIEVRLQSMNSSALAAGILMPALARNRQLAFRMTSGTNLSGIGKACLIYANDHDDRLPPDLETLVREVEVSPKTLESKLKPEGFDGPSYIYIAGQTTDMSYLNVVAYENPEFCEDGVNVLFLDTHVEFMEPEEFREALKATCERLGRAMPGVRFKNEPPSDEPGPASGIRVQDSTASRQSFREAAEQGDVQTLRRLIEDGVSIDAVDDDGQTALCLALRSEQVEAASLLIRAGADVNTQGSNWGVPLMIAARLGQTDIVRMLIERGADVNASLSTGWTPLLMAARFGHTEIARMLLDAGAKTDARTREEMTPLLFAVLHGFPEIERMLTNRGVKPDIFAEAMRGDAEEVAARLQKSPHLAHEKVGNLTLLHWAAYCDHLDVGRVLLDCGADVNAVSEVAPPLHWAVRKNHVEFARLLLSHGAAVNTRGRGGITVAHYIVAPEMVDLLAEHGGDMDAASETGMTPLLSVVSATGHREVLKLLLPEEADVHLDHPAEMHHRAAEQQAAVAEALLGHGADINAQVEGKRTALDLAEGLRYEPVVQTLRRHGGKRSRELNAPSSDQSAPAP